MRPFIKEMKKLRSTWVSDMSRRYAGGGSIYKLADMSDSLIDTFIGGGTAATMEMIFNLERGQDEAYKMVVSASQIMSAYGVSLYDPVDGGTRDPSTFLLESQEILEERQRRMAARLEGREEPHPKRTPRPGTEPPASTEALSGTGASPLYERVKDQGEQVHEEARERVEEGAKDQTQLRAEADERRKRLREQRIVEEEEARKAIPGHIAEHGEPDSRECWKCGRPGVTFWVDIYKQNMAFHVVCAEHKDYRPRVATGHKEQPEDPYLYDCYLCSDPGAGTQYWENFYYVIVCVDHLDEPVPAFEST